MGQGMIIATPNPDNVQQVAQDYGIDSKVIGRVTEDAKIRIRNKGMFNPSQNTMDGVREFDGQEYLVFG